MAISARTARIGGATLVAAFLVVGAYVLPGLDAPETKTVNAELTDDILAAYVSKDTDADGLPDWQETLYGTDSTIADTDRDGINDGEAVRRGLLTPTSLSSQLPSDPIGEEDIPGEAPAAGSVTERFSQTLFQAYLEASNGEPLTSEAQQALVVDLLKRFQAESAKTLISSYTRVSIRISGMSSTEYAGRMEQILESSIPDAPGEDIFSVTLRLVQEKDADAGKRLSEAEGQHREAVARLLENPVPAATADAHLTLVRSLDQTRRALAVIQRYEEDPVLALGGVLALSEANESTIAALASIGQSVLAEGEPLPGAPGYLTVDTARRIQSQ